MEFKNAYSLVPSQERGVLDLKKNGLTCLCRFTQPIPVQAKIATNEKGFALQFTPCNTTCPNLNVTGVKNEQGESVPHITITCGSGVRYPVTFEEPAIEEATILKIEK